MIRFSLPLTLSVWNSFYYLSLCHSLNHVDISFLLYLLAHWRKGRTMRTSSGSLFDTGRLRRPFRSIERFIITAYLAVEPRALLFFFTGVQSFYFYGGHYLGLWIESLTLKWWIRIFPDGLNNGLRPLTDLWTEGALHFLLSLDVFLLWISQGRLLRFLEEHLSKF